MDGVKSNQDVLKLISSFLDPKHSSPAPDSSLVENKQAVPESTESHAPQVGVICFSKDRPFQLREYLRSVSLLLRAENARLCVNVLWTASTGDKEILYERVEREFAKSVHFVREGRFDVDLETILEDNCQQCKYIVFGVDDAVFFRRADLDAAIELMHLNPRVVVFHLKLALGMTFCHPALQHMTPPPEDSFEYAANGRVLSFPLGVGTLDWNYPWDLCGSMYRRDDVLDVLCELEPEAFSHPNKLEVNGQAAFRTCLARKLAKEESSQNQMAQVLAWHEARAGLFVGEQKMAVVTVNRVQDIYDNPVYDCANGNNEEDQDLDRFFDSSQFDLAWFRSVPFDRVHIGQYKLMPKFDLSILIPFHNAKDSLDAAVRSLLEPLPKTLQDHARIQVVLVDDLSQDGSLHVAKALQAEFSCLESVQVDIVGSQDHLTATEGPSEARGRVARALNAGLLQVAGELVARMDADDISSSQRLDRQLAFLREHPDCAAVGSGAVFLPDSTTLQQGQVALESSQASDLRSAPIASTPEMVAWSLNFYCCVVHPTVVVRRDVFLNLFGYGEDQVAEDYDFWLRAVEAGYQVDNLNEGLLGLRLHSSSATASRSVEDKRITQVETALAHLRRLGVVDSSNPASFASLYKLHFGSFPPEMSHELQEEDEQSLFIKSFRMLLDMFDKIKVDMQDDNTSVREDLRARLSELALSAETKGVDAQLIWQHLESNFHVSRAQVLLQTLQ